MGHSAKAWILNVASEAAERELITRILNRQGFSVRAAATAAEALNLSQDTPELVVLAIPLPDMDPAEFCRSVQAGSQSGWTPVLLVVDPVPGADHASGDGCDPDAYLPRPVDPLHATALVKTLLRARRAESEARRTARDWQSTFEAVGHGLCLLDSEGRVLRVNAALSSILGRDPEALVGTAEAGLYGSAASRPKEGWPFERCRLSRRRETAEIPVGQRWLQVTADPLLDEAGSFRGCVHTLVEITGHKRAVQERERLLDEMEHQSARLRAVVEQMPAGLIMVAAGSGALLLANEQASRILRRPFEPSAGAPLLEGLHPDGVPYEPEQWPLHRALHGGEVVTNEEIQLVRGDGSRAWVLMSAGPVRDRAGAVVAGLVEFQEITERKQLEDELRHSQKMEAVGRLAGGVAHDFNNLLTIIGGYGQMVMDSLEPGDPLVKDVESILEASGRASALTRQLLSVSRRQILQPRSFDLNRLISRMNRILRRVIGEDVELVTTLRSQRSRIRADVGQIEQVVLNLAVNARDAMPTGGRLSLETADVEIGADAPAGGGLAAGRYVQLSIGDTGTGMPPAVLDHMFEPFFTTKPKGKGTGLGLSTAYGTVKQTGGEIQVQSKVGEGTSFSIYFPADTAPDPEAAAGEETFRAIQRQGGSETILLVEDEDEVRRLAAEMLLRQGYTVLEASCGPDAIQVWSDARDQVDLLLTDVVMPKMSGQELAAVLRTARPGLRVLYMSGYTEEVVARHGGVEPQSALLMKPFTSETLVRMVRLALDREE